MICLLPNPGSRLERAPLLFSSWWHCRRRDAARCASCSSSIRCEYSKPLCSLSVRPPLFDLTAQAFELVFEGYRPQLLVVAADRRHLTRLFVSSPEDSPAGSNGNVPSVSAFSRERVDSHNC